MITIRIEDPETIILIAKYSCYVRDVDGATGTLDELAEGLMLGLLDAHDRFRQWCGMDQSLDERLYCGCDCG
ncbi:hypothetical protein DX912_11395 [Lysobacter soli]|uniref:Uncharacterized protein n=1 Tax=Lysobacter soli TaxID=453783 RepID=A0A3D8VBC0_9GAMM|nr:hypothetical protein DX912_11395 [Lysobacter soli]